MKPQHDKRREYVLAARYSQESEAFSKPSEKNRIKMLDSR